MRVDFIDGYILITNDGISFKGETASQYLFDVVDALETTHDLKEKIIEFLIDDGYIKQCEWCSSYTSDFVKVKQGLLCWVYICQDCNEWI